MEWKLAISAEFKKMAEENQLCIVPLACLERHGEHMPLGTDGLIGEKIAVEAAKIEPCMVFPTLYFGGQVSEATCFPGAVALPNKLCFELWDNICSEISRNGFKKILFFSTHGGNNGALIHYAMSTMDRDVDYSFYWTSFNLGMSEDETKQIDKIEPITGQVYGHACQWECDLVMSAAPDSVDLSLVTSKDTIEPLNRLKHLGRIETGFGWYSQYPDHQCGTPVIATKEKGDKLMEIYINRLAKDIKIIKEDKELPNLRKEFTEKKNKVGK